MTRDETILILEQRLEDARAQRNKLNREIYALGKLLDEEKARIAKASEPAPDEYPDVPIRLRNGGIIFQPFFEHYTIG